jgi:ribosomal-protein-alanine N-acetyltransferase
MPEMNKPTLETERLILRPLRTSDSEELVEKYQHEEVNRLTGTRKRFTIEEIEGFLASIQNDAERYDFAMLRKESGEMIGEAVLTEIDEANLSAGFRIAIYDPMHFSQGFGSEAIREVLRFAFEDIGLNRVGLEVFDFNERAIKGYFRSGFRVEGVIRNGHRWEGEYHDIILMGILRSEFPPSPQARSR